MRGGWNGWILSAGIHGVLLLAASVVAYTFSVPVGIGTADYSCSVREPALHVDRVERPRESWGTWRKPEGDVLSAVEMPPDSTGPMIWKAEDSDGDLGTDGSIVICVFEDDEKNGSVRQPICPSGERSGAYSYKIIYAFPRWLLWKKEALSGFVYRARSLENNRTRAPRLLTPEWAGSPAPSRRP